MVHFLNIRLSLENRDEQTLGDFMTNNIYRISDVAFILYLPNSISADKGIHIRKEKPWATKGESEQARLFEGAKTYINRELHRIYPNSEL